MHHAAKLTVPQVPPTLTSSRPDLPGVPPTRRTCTACQMVVYKHVQHELQQTGKQASICSHVSANLNAWAGSHLRTCRWSLLTFARWRQGGQCCRGRNRSCGSDRHCCSRAGTLLRGAFQHQVGSHWIGARMAEHPVTQAIHGNLCVTAQLVGCLCQAAAESLAPCGEHSATLGECASGQAAGPAGAVVVWKHLAGQLHARCSAGAVAVRGRGAGGHAGQEQGLRIECQRHSLHRCKACSIVRAQRAQAAA